MVGPPTTRPPQRLAATARPWLPVRDLGDYLYEPDGAVIRAGGVAELGLQLGAGLLDRQLAYLTADRLQTTPFATAYAVQDQLPYRPRCCTGGWSSTSIGRLEIKQRGVEVDPARTAPRSSGRPDRTRRP